MFTASIDLRLVDGQYTNEGRLEVRLSGEETWGSYCSNENPFFAGRAACRQLGFPAYYPPLHMRSLGKEPVQSG